MEFFCGLRLSWVNDSFFQMLPNAFIYIYIYIYIYTLLWGWFWIFLYAFTRTWSPSKFISFKVQMENICDLFILMYLLQLLQIILSHSFLFSSEGSKRQNEQLLRHWSVFSGEIENTSSRSLRRRLWQRISALALVESLHGVMGETNQAYSSFTTVISERKFTAVQTVHATSEKNAPFALTVDEKLVIRFLN